MCVIIYKPKDTNLPTFKTLESCFNHNEHGAGYMLPLNGEVVIRKGFMTFKEFINSDYSDGLTSSGERGTYKNYLQCMIDGRNAIVHGYSFQLSYINAIVYPRIAISISDWYLTQFSPGGAAERIITSDELQRSDSINVVRRERAARNLGIGEDASATSLD